MTENPRDRRDQSQMELQAHPRYAASRKLDDQRQAVQRRYCLEGLQLRNKTPKRKVSAKQRSDRTQASRQNEGWAMDFMSDQLFDGTRLCTLTIVDAYTRSSPAIETRKSYRADDVVNPLERVAKKYVVPKEVRVDV